jgi:hypothetical protein
MLYKEMYLNSDKLSCLRARLEVTSLLGISYIPRKSQLINYFLLANHVFTNVKYLTSIRVSSDSGDRCLDLRT